MAPKRKRIPAAERASRQEAPSRLLPWVKNPRLISGSSIHLSKLGEEETRALAALLASGSSSRTVRVQRVRAGLEEAGGRLEATAGRDAVTAAAFSPCGAALVTGCAAGSLRCYAWHEGNTKAVAIRLGLRGSIPRCMFSPYFSDE